jgi:hypothetical protein
MNSYGLSQIYFWIKVFGYSCMLLYWFFTPESANIISDIIRIAFLRFFEILFSSYFRNRRTRKLKKIADKLGFEFYKTDKNKIIMPMLEGLPLLIERRPRTKNILYDILVILEIMVWLLFSVRERFNLENILINKKEYQGIFFAVFDYNKQLYNPQNNNSSSDATSGRSINNQSETMIIFAFEDLKLPEFSVISKEKTVYQKIFNSICRLAGHERIEEDQISQIFSTNINDFYKAEKNFCTLAKGYRLMCYRHHKLIKPRKIESFLSTGFQLLELFKATDSINGKQSVDYTKLRDLLKVGNWKEADKETSSILLKAIGKKLENKNIKIDVNLFDTMFLSSILHAIDALWIEYSKGHFGFSLQKRIWSEVGGKVDYNSERLLADRVGWRVKGKWLYYSDLTFSLNAPQGHLPTTELSLLPLGWLYLGKRPLFKIPGSIRLVRQMNLPACFIASKF